MIEITSTLRMLCIGSGNVSCFEPANVKACCLLIVTGSASW